MGIMEKKMGILFRVASRPPEAYLQVASYCCSGYWTEVRVWDLGFRV